MKKESIPSTLKLELINNYYSHISDKDNSINNYGINIKQSYKNNLNNELELKFSNTNTPLIARFIDEFTSHCM